MGAAINADVSLAEHDRRAKSQDILHNNNNNNNNDDDDASLSVAQHKLSSVALMAD